MTQFNEKVRLWEEQKQGFINEVKAKEDRNIKDLTEINRKYKLITQEKEELLLALQIKE
jgi:uncharacterized protein YeaO (DUF488 family)